jgi:tetratricopeptide (TPR) repeat protein
MVEFHLDFTQQKDPQIYQLYEELQNNFVSPEDIDVGFLEANFNSQTCPENKASYCLQGQRDTIIQKAEVFEYALRQPSKYYSSIQSIFGNPIPWALDDKNSQTNFDYNVRYAVEETISSIKDILETKGLSEDSSEFKKLMAIGLFCRLITPAQSEASEETSNWQLIQSILEEHGFKELESYLSRVGGFAIQGSNNSVSELTALDTLYHQKGECTELSYVLFTMLQMAGLNPSFVNTTGEAIIKAFPDKAQSMQDDYMMGHVYVGLNIEGEKLFLDPGMKTINPSYAYYYEVGLRQTYNTFLTNSAIQMMRRMRHDQAKILLDQTLILDEHDDCAYLDYGHMYLTLGDYEKARYYATQAIQNNPRDSRTYLNLALLDFEEKNYEGVIANAGAVIKQSPGFYMAYALLAFAYCEIGDTKQALLICEQCLSLRSDWHPIYLTRSHIYIKLNELDKATADIETTETLIQEEDEDLFNTANIHYLKALIAQKKSEHDKIEPLLLAAIEKFPIYNVYYYSLGMHYWTEYKDNKALEYINKGLLLEETNFEDSFNLLCAEDNDQQRKLLEQELLLRIDQNADQTNLWNFLAYQYAKKGFVSFAFQCLETAQGIQPENRTSTELAGMLDHVSGNSKSGHEKLVQALEQAFREPEKVPFSIPKLITHIIHRLYDLFYVNEAEPVALYHARSLVSYALWDLGETEQATQLFKLAIDEVRPVQNRKISQSLRKILILNYKNMPRSMKQDLTIRELKNNILS